MEEQKKQSPQNGGGQRDNGQRISVRPGNFNPPPQKKNAPAKDQKSGEGTGGNAGGKAQNNRGHHGRNRHKHGHRPSQQAGQQTPQATKQEKKQAVQPQVAAPANRNDNRRHGNRHKSAKTGTAAPATQLSASLQRELDEEFRTPTLSPSLSSPFKKDAEQERIALDSNEFAVDIATAAYLTDDIPCGFPAPDGKAVEVVGVRFRDAGKVYFFAPGEHKFRIGESAIVDTARGPEIGNVVFLNRKVAEKNLVQPLRSVLRRATPEDVAHHEENQKKEIDALRVCAEKIAAHKLDMRLVDAQYTFDNSKLLFYFTSEGRVDFRELVRELAGVFHTRIELRQIGIRDESRLIGGLGMCGRPFCCTTYLSDFGQVSIKMAKEQGLSINTSKISGCCGRLMCCLRYEHETYTAESRLTPAKDSTVQTADGVGVVVDRTPLAGTVKVRLNAAPEEPPRIYHRDDITVLEREKRVHSAENAANIASKKAENEEK